MARREDIERELRELLLFLWDSLAPPRLEYRGEIEQKIERVAEAIANHNVIYDEPQKQSRKTQKQSSKIEWTDEEHDAANHYVNKAAESADGKWGAAWVWRGWALREAFLCGMLYERERK